MVTIVNINTGAKAEVTEPAARRRIASGRWYEDTQTPASSDKKAVWVDHAVAQGMDRDEAEAMTKADLVDTYGA